MRGPAVHQLLPTFAPRDAVGNHTIELRRALHARGVDSEVFAQVIHHELLSSTRSMTEVPDDDSWIVYHHSIGGLAGEYFEERPGRRILIYHNITPLEMLDRWEPGVGAEIVLGRDQLARYSTICDLAIADSEFNRTELVELGYQNTVTVPVLFDPAALANASDPATAQLLRRSRRGTQLLFVGRVVPNKAQHDLVSALALYRRAYDPHAHLHLVGSQSFASYGEALRNQIESLELDDAVTIHDSISDGMLAAHYENADVFVCLSDHEGFCVPLVEAMHHGVPVVAFDSSAVGGTLDGAGILLPSKEPDLVAAAVDRVVSDPTLSRTLARAGRRRAADFDLSRTSAAYIEAIESVTGPLGDR